MTVRVGINGFGRIGRNFFRAAKQRGADIDFVAVNDLGSLDDDGPPAEVRLGPRHAALRRSRRTRAASPSTATMLKVLSERDPKDLPWGDLGVDVVIESTGIFTKRDTAAAHLDGGAPLVIVSAPCDGADATFVYGVNHKDFDPKTDKVISNASCTTNCFVPMVKVLDDAFGVEQGLMQTVHAYTGDQMLVDGPHHDLRRARARGDQHHAHVHRRGPRHEPRAGVDEGQARRHVAARAGADRLDRRLHRQPRRRRRPSSRSTRRSSKAAEAAR